MALNVTISKGTTYTLRAERVTHSFDRSVSPNALPSGTEGQAGQVFVLDLGMCVQQIIIEGLVDNVSKVPSGPNQEPTKVELEDVIKTWYVQYSIGGDNNPAQITLPTGLTTNKSYSGFFKNASFTMTGGLEDRWQYSILFYVVS
jgi:hypothetical protein